jgi:leucyl-tRNA synthetase
VGEELWARIGHSDSLTFVPFPQADPALLVAETVTCVLQVGGKVRDRIEVPADSSEESLRELALANEKVIASLAGREVRTVVVRAPKLVNVVPV